MNFAHNNAKYISSDEPAFYGKNVEMVPKIILKTGCNLSIKDFSISYQYSYNHEQFTDATNAIFQTNAVVGIIPPTLLWTYHLNTNIKNSKLKQVLTI